MSSQNMFNASELKTLQFTPLWVFGAVATADGKVDQKEIEALGREISQAHLYNEPLARDVLMSLAGDFKNIFELYGKDSRNVVQGLKEVADLLDRKVSPQVSYNFKGAMLMIGYNVSESTGKGFLGFGQKALDQKHKALDTVAMIMRFSLVATPVATKPVPSSSPTAISPYPSPKPSKRTSVYFLIDSSRHISDIAYLLDDGLRRIPEKIRARSQRGVQIDMSLILADSTGRVVTPLTEAAKFSSPSLLGRGSCGFGQALQNLLKDISFNRMDGKPLVVLVLAGAPEDSWESAADQLRTLAQNGKVNVFVLGVGGYSDSVVLKRLTTNSPLLLADVSQANMHKSFDWLYEIVDIILTGMESGATGQRRNIPAPPVCLNTLS